jgi:hypothetical protein
MQSGAPLSVIRLERTGDHGTARQLRPEVLAALWADLGCVKNPGQLLGSIDHAAVAASRCSVSTSNGVR